ncbi:MAG: hypothetical protein QOD06_3400 [Candidatus Binatota bacterium]|nr:hypothetical protein [Candidatus Binatota bacterium]
MKAYVTASFDAAALARLATMMDVVHEDWRVTHKVFFAGEELARRIRDVGADVLIVEADLVHEEVIEGTKLAIIGAARGDPLNVRLDLATARGIPVIFAPARNAGAVAELTVTFILSVLRHVHEVHHELRSGRLDFERPGDYLGAYSRYVGVELAGKTVGVVGFGAIGRRVARLVAAFDARVLVFDPYVPESTVTAAGAETADPDRIVRECDVLTVHCPETPETVNLLDAERIRALRPGAVVMNLARARILDEDALYEGLCSGRIAGAGLDVLSHEPVRRGERFLSLPNVLVLPHYGGNTRETVIRQSRMIVDGIEDLLAGRRPRHLCNPGALAG